MGRLRVLLDTNIYGYVIEFDLDLVQRITSCNRIVVYGNTVIRKELRDTPKEKKTETMQGYRMLLLNNFDLIAGKHVIPVTKQTEELAKEYEGKAVVGPHGRNGSKQANGSRYQRFGNARGHGSQRDLLKGRQANKGMHDPPDRTKQADIR